MQQNYPNNQNGFTVYNNPPQPPAYPVYPQKNFIKKEKKSKKKLMISIISLVVVSVIIVVGVVINHNGYENGECGINNCRDIIPHLAYPLDGEEEISEYKHELDQNIKEAQKYSFFLPEQLKKELKAYESFQKEYPSREERDEIWEDCRQLDSDIVAYMNAIDGLISVLNNLCKYNIETTFDNIQSAYDNCIQLESEIEHRLAKILDVESNKINIVYNGDNIFQLSETLISKIKASSFEKNQKIQIKDIYNTTNEQNAIIYEFERILIARDLGIQMLENNSWEKRIETHGSNLEEIRESLVGSEIKIPYECFGFDSSLSASVLKEVTMPIIEKYGIDKYTRGSYK